MESAEIPQTLSKLDKQIIEMIAVNADVKLQNQISDFKWLRFISRPKHL